MTRRWREWTPEQQRASAARAAHLFMNMVSCRDCGLTWPEGLIHDDCPGPAIPDLPADGRLLKEAPSE